jgi:hypothetical protein
LDVTWNEDICAEGCGKRYGQLKVAVVGAIVVPALRKVREGRGTRCCGGFCSLKAGPPAPNANRSNRSFSYLPASTVVPPPSRVAKVGFFSASTSDGGSFRSGNVWV